MFNKLFALVLTTISFNTLADWQLQNERSKLSFVSGKTMWWRSAILVTRYIKQDAFFSTDLTS